MKTIKINLGNRSYNIVIGNKTLSKLPDYLNKLDKEISKTEKRGLGKYCLLITDPNINKLWGKKVINVLKKYGFTVYIYIVPQGEKNKSFNNYKKIIDYIFDTGKPINTIISLGGGVVGDLSGFAASSYKRGTHFIQIPTTLLGCVDCSVGGKTGVNYKKYKNMVGTFYQPRLVFIDSDFLTTLSKEEFRNGFAEVIKYGIAFDRTFFNYLYKNINPIFNLKSAAVNHIIKRSCELKAAIVEEDEYDRKDIRASLNLGHTFGHCFESIVGLGNISHGQGVALGMLAASYLSEKYGYISSYEIKLIYNIIKKSGLPYKIKSYNKKKFKSAVMRDKKFINNNIKLVLINEIGKYTIKENIPLDDLYEAVDYITN